MASAQRFDDLVVMIHTEQKTGTIEHVGFGSARLEWVSILLPPFLLKDYRLHIQLTLSPLFSETS